MRLSFLFRSVVGFLFCWTSALIAHATHELGSELTYQYVGTVANPNLYHITARLFRDPNTVIQTNNVIVTCGRNECGNTLPGSFTVLLTLTSSVLKTNGCSGSVGISYRLMTLEGDVQLPPARWTLSIQATNRRSDIINVPQSSQQNFYVSSELDNTTGLVDSSPRFLTTQLILLSSTQPQLHQSLSAFDSDGDSLVYQLVPSLGTASTISACATGTIGTVAPHFQLNAATGELLTLAGPTQQGFYDLAARVDEYRRLNGSWQRIGSVTRDIMYLVALSNNQLPAFNRVALTSNPTGQLLGQTIRVNPGQTLSLTLTAADPDAGQVLTLTSDVAGLVPGATFQDQGNGQGLLTWQVPAAQPLGRYTLTAMAADNACPTAGATAVTLPILVTQQVLATQPAHQNLAQLPYPTPFSEEVRFQLQGAGRQPVAIVDGLGRTVAHLATDASGNVVWRPEAGIAAGLYFARNLDGSQVARLSYSGR
ncbi:hypothetical protein [Hymenobacter rubidus]|uniref:hypothetical protein n=1 Tax=Hymenobacter rubidus TaxID=1441626 RepID=UPI00191FD125|nr:hypothetical protein [Hymenobacter rubidus]